MTVLATAIEAEGVTQNSPHHIAIIMDGNGRWATSRGLPRAIGHKQGAQALGKLIEGAGTLGVDYLTVYAFSTENWQRPENEISELMGLLRYYLCNELKTIHDSGTRIQVIGDRDSLAADIQKEIESAEQLTSQNTGLTLVIALSYGSRHELLRAVRGIAKDAVEGNLALDAIDENLLLSRPDTHNVPDPDLLIRTGGEQRLSNFLLWQAAYSELWFTPVLWPDFTLAHLQEAMEDYARRERRYGRTDSK